MPLAIDSLLSYEELLKVAQVAVRLGAAEVEVTGGEPLVRPGVVEFIADLCRLPEQPTVSLTTNGLLLAEFAADLVAAGLSRIHVGLDTLQTERYRKITRSDGLERVWRGLEAAERAGLAALQLNMVPIRGVNDDEIVEFARLTLHHDWDICFIEFMPSGQARRGEAELRFPAARIMEELSRLGMLLPVTREKDSCPTRRYRLANGLGRIGVLSTLLGHVGTECRRLQIDADGHLRPCQFTGHEFDLGPLLRTGDTDKDLRQALLAAVNARPEQSSPGPGCWSKTCRPMAGVGG